MATYAIGDIQGCFESFMALLKRIDFDKGADQLWLAGDLVNRGPRSLEVLRWVIDHESQCQVVLGNHDLNLLAVAAGVRGHKERDTLHGILEASDRNDLLQWLRQRPLMVRDGNTLMVHAGLLPQWSVEQAETLARQLEGEIQGSKNNNLLKRTDAAKLGSWSRVDGEENRKLLALAALTRLRTLDLDGVMDDDFNGEPSALPPGRLPWFSHPTRQSQKARIIFGHWAALGLYRQDLVVGLDSGCVWGGVLTAIRLDDDAIFQQPAVE